MFSLRRLAARLTVLVPLAALFAVACEHSPSAPGVPATITVTRNPDTLAVTTSKQFIAIARDADGSVVGITPTWSVAAGGGSINSSGLFTAAGVIGSFANTVKASYGSLSGTASVTVIAGPLATITLTPTPTTLSIGGTQQYTAVGKDAGGNTVAISPTWSVSGGSGSISGAGLFTAGSVPGTFANTVMATSGGISGHATVTVIPGPLATISVTPNPSLLVVGATQQLTAAGRDAGGNLVAITPVWSLVAGGGTISASGLFTAGGTPGTFANTARATSGAISGTATVNVTAGSLASITVTPNPASMSVGAAQQFTAVGRDAGGNVVQFTPTWSVVAGGGSVNSAGLFTAGTVSGTFTNTIQASREGITGFATVTVTPGPLASITVTPNPTTLSVGLSRLFTAAGRDANGNMVAITPTWSIVAGGGTINTSGLFTAGSTPGTFTNTVTATAGSISGVATVNVTSGVLASITVTPHPVNLAIGATQQFTAVGKDAGGNVVAITPTWATVAGGGSINLTTGLFTAGNVTGTYTNTVRASVGGLAGFATVIVTSGALSSVTVTPTPVSVQTNGTQQFTAIGKDGSGNDFVITPVWSVVSGGGSINASTGLFTAGAVAGTFTNTVKATSGAVSGFATVTVTAVAPSLATITVTPNPETMLPNGTQQFAAIGRDGSNNLFPLSPVWSVVNGGGSIDPSTGLFTAGALTGTFTNTVRATSGLISGTATVIVSAAAPPPVVDLGTAAPNGIMAGTAVTCINGGLISADVSVSPGSTVTGFPPCVITGVQNLANAVAAQAQIDLTTAYNTLAGMPCAPANAIVADLGGTTKPAGVYCTASGIGVTGTLTLNGGGDPNATFVFQAGSSLTTAGNIVLINGAQAKNVYWQVGSSATLGTGSQWQGNILALSSITLVDTATLLGRALARNGAVSLGTSNTITLPPL
ncbi:MAG TPA: ice-binding family protein [Longimicrobiales bacterium]|nr:ice-binding family protein [Longimicrobiales bacterium]